MKKIIVFVVMVCLLLGISLGAMAYGEECPVCGYYGWFTGESKTEWGHLFYLYKCANSHFWWERQY